MTSTIEPNTDGTAVVVGTGVGGVRTALGLREQGFRGRIVLLGAESQLPYDRPPLSKQFLSGEWDAERLSLLTESAAHEARIELWPGTAARGLDVHGGRVLLDGGQSLAFDHCVIATGCRARPAPWHVESGLHVIRELADSAALRRDLSAGGPVVIVGGGFIGMEAAATAVLLGLPVTVVDPDPMPLARSVGPEIAALLTDVHVRHGVVARFGVGVEDVRGRRGDLHVRLADGTALRAATVVVGIGAVPNVEWLAGSGLHVADGVACDEHGRAVGAEGVHAVGDVARWRGPEDLDARRTEHWTNAVDQAAVVAHNIVHPDRPGRQDALPYVWSDQYDHKVQVVGRPAGAADCKVLEGPDGPRRRVAALYSDDAGALVGVTAVNWPKATVLARKLLARRAGVGEAVDEVQALAAPR
ncbi:FAD-dependent oxidoreductase [Streptomyces sp. M2CJ-2]|uniref:NAD(P)/FAD-dependent oxidoreductase n=1 Tax=Streptomyces sp. M2CJ-2 TaxID=2803948 RepID=UPI001926A80D|nr:FAD-dependent oxidoreductase [Streptomyces sp. M2CJ-2]MBL3668050.1 FAD-dependent oxidoreductase [Streptomyces sp. M2CJ-2]